MLELTTKVNDGPVETIDLFSIDGKTYGIPKDIDMTMALRALDAIRKRGEMSAVSELLEEVLGDEAYQALLAFKGLKGDQLKQLMNDVNTYVMGQLEDAAGN